MKQFNFQVCFFNYFLVRIQRYVEVCKILPRVRVEGHTLVYNGLLLKVVTWIEICLLSILTTSSFIYIGDNFTDF